MSELYQQVWAQVFANAWTAYQGKPENQAKVCTDRTAQESK